MFTSTERNLLKQSIVNVTTDGITKLKKHLFVTAGSFIVTIKSNHNSGVAYGINLRTTGTYNCMVAV